MTTELPEEVPLFRDDELHKFCGNMPPPGTTRPEGVPQLYVHATRTRDQQDLHQAIVDAIIPDYSNRVVMGSHSLKKGQKLDWGILVEQHAKAQWVGQRTGSCVGTNSFNILMIELLVESIIKQQAEEIDVDYWWPYPYGWGRHFGGMNGEGDGSYQSVQFKAFKDKGIPHLKDFSFPEYSDENGARWISSKLEYKWSSRRNIPSELDSVADDHLVLDGAMIHTMSELNNALMTGPVGYAGMLGSNKIYTKEGVKMSDWTGSWSHCMGVDGIWNHPEMGMLYKIMNRSWTPSQYSWFWITEKTMEKVVRHNATELMVIRDFDGIEKAGIDLDWLIDLITRLTS